MPLLPCSTHERSRHAYYGVLAPDRQYPARHTFYIGPDGTILFIDRAVKPAIAGEAIVAKLQELGVKDKK